MKAEGCQGDGRIAVAADRASRSRVTGISPVAGKTLIFNDDRQNTRVLAFSVFKHSWDSIIAQN